eukprot:Gb_23880 [translate_table: standard]
MGTKDRTSFWPRFKRRIKHGEKSSAKPNSYAGKYDTVYAQISAGGKTRVVARSAGNPEALVRIVSVSRGEFILSPASAKENSASFELETSVTSLKSHKSENCNEQDARIGDDIIKGDKAEEASLQKLDHRSWVRIVKRIAASGLPTPFLVRKTRNGKVRQYPHRTLAVIRDSESKPIKPNSPEIQEEQFPAHDSPRGSISAPIEQPNSNYHISAAVDGNIHKNRKLKARVAASAPSTPTGRHGIESLPRQDLPSRATKIQREASLESTKTILESRGCFWDRLGPKTGEDYNAALSVSVLIIVLGILALSDRLCTIICTSIWWYLLPKLRNLLIGGVNRNSKNDRRRKLNKSLSNNNLDLQSSEYRKKVIMEGLLQRNHR